MRWMRSAKAYAYVCRAPRNSPCRCGLMWVREAVGAKRTRSAHSPHPSATRSACGRLSRERERGAIVALRATAVLNGAGAKRTNVDDSLTTAQRTAPRFMVVAFSWQRERTAMRQGLAGDDARSAKSFGRPNPCRKSCMDVRVNAL